MIPAPPSERINTTDSQLNFDSRLCRWRPSLNVESPILSAPLQLLLLSVGWSQPAKSDEIGWNDLITNKLGVVNHTDEEIWNGRIFQTSGNKARGSKSTRFPSCSGGQIEPESLPTLDIKRWKEYRFCTSSLDIVSLALTNSDVWEGSTHIQLIINQLNIWGAI